MSITTLLDDGTIRVEHDIDVAIHPDSHVPTRVSTRRYRLRHRPPDGAWPRQIPWTYSFYKYRTRRDELARHRVSRGDLVQVWDFPGSPDGTLVFKDSDEIARRWLNSSRIGEMAIGDDGKLHRLTEDGWS